MAVEARLERTENGVVPRGEGWFVTNVREARWWHSDELGSAVAFEGDVPFPEYGINIQVLRPGEPNCMYHGENSQEDFLVLAGECTLLIDGQERSLRQWDFVHSPAWTDHVFVGAGDGPCAILMVGSRADPDALRYPVVDVALKHGAGVETETTRGSEAYSRFSPAREGRYPDGVLPADGR